MSNWDKLSMREKAAYIKVGVQNGLTSISDIKEYYDRFQDIDSEKFNNYNNNYNDTVNKFDEGGEKDVTNNLNLLDKALLGISSTIMELGRSGNIRFKTKGSKGAAQDTYLLPRNLQKKVFLDAGYIEGDPGDYGLVKKAVGNRNIPVYQTAPDTVSREDLIVLGNPKQSEQCYYPTNNALYHAGSYPSALYMDTDYNIYRKSWDLNDYGNTTGTAGTTYGNKQWKANLIDKIGSPVVVTTGFQPVMDNIYGGEQINLIDLFNRKDPHAMKYIEQQKLYPLYEDIPIYYNNEPVLKYDGSPMTYTDVTMFSNAPEIIVTPKGNYVYNSYDNRVNKFGGGGYTTPEELALEKLLTAKPASNYSQAVDMNISKAREWVTDQIQNLFPNCPTGLSNCTLTASQFYGKPIGRAATIVNNPNKHGFYEVDEKYAIPGTMVIASDPEGTETPRYHTMILNGFADKNYPFVYNDILYNVLEGDILTSYSKGKNTIDSWKTNIPLKTYTDQSQGKTRNRFYRPLDENGLPNVLLPEIVVTANK